MEGAVNLVVEAGDRGEEDRLECRTVFDELQRVTLVVAYFHASVESEAKESLLERMRVRQVRDDSFARLEIRQLSSGLC